MRTLVGIRFDEGPLAEVEFLLVAKIGFGAADGLIFGQRSARSVFGKLVIDGEERTVRLELDGIFVRLAVAKIADLPDRAGDLRGVDFIEARDADALAEEFVDEWIGDVGENDGAAIGIWIEAALAHRLIGEGMDGFWMDR